MMFLSMFVDIYILEDESRLGLCYYIFHYIDDGDKTTHFLSCYTGYRLAIIYLFIDLSK